MGDDVLLPFDARKPNIARAYDYLLGGKDNFAPDRELAARVVYVDNDPVVVSHARALLSGECVVAIPGDMREPDAILADPALAELINLGEPACLVLCAVLHFIDAATVRAVVAAAWWRPVRGRFRRPCPRNAPRSGSCLPGPAASRRASDDPPPLTMQPWLAREGARSET
jgi:hypothetical protein